MASSCLSMSPSATAWFTSNISRRSASVGSSSAIASARADTANASISLPRIPSMSDCTPSAQAAVHRSPAGVATSSASAAHRAAASIWPRLRCTRAVSTSNLARCRGWIPGDDRARSSVRRYSVGYPSNAPHWVSVHTRSTTTSGSVTWVRAAKATLAASSASPTRNSASANQHTSCEYGATPTGVAANAQRSSRTAASGARAGQLLPGRGQPPH